jgi:hypothetical protein
MDYSGKVSDLFLTQLHDWDLAAANYSLLGKVQSRVLSFGTFQLLLQYNPERMRSSSAKVDPKSIGERPCFLCEKNRPAEQRGILYGDNLTILVNPFPIFRRHLTIVSGSHTDQRILPNFRSMLSLADALSEYVIFYNGPQCGASAPDHFHFQAGNRGFLPIENDFGNRKSVVLLRETNGVAIRAWSGYMRGIATLTSGSADSITEVFNMFFERFRLQQPDNPEPMLNILAYKDKAGYTVHLIPRILHRPRQFFAEGDSQILLSPASVDLGGVIITPREADFHKITNDDIKDIFSQVSMDDTGIRELFNNFQ